LKRKFLSTIIWKIRKSAKLKSVPTINSTWPNLCSIDEDGVLHKLAPTLINEVKNLTLPDYLFLLLDNFDDIEQRCTLISASWELLDLPNRKEKVSYELVGSIMHKAAYSERSNFCVFNRRRGGEVHAQGWVFHDGRQNQGRVVTMSGELTHFLRHHQVVIAAYRKHTISA
jgi:hypothetical protein